MDLGIVGSGEFGVEIRELADRINRTEKRWNRIYFIETSDIAAEGFIEEDSFFRNTMPGDVECVVATGEVAARERLYKLYKSKGYCFATIIAPEACVSGSAKIKEGCLVLPFVYIAHNATVEDNAVLHVHTIVENNATIGRNSFVNGGAFIGAYAEIGQHVFIGPNATVRDRVTVGNGSIVGMGGVVTKSVAPDGVYVGNPARCARPNTSRKIFG